eukprot:gene9883-10893_t
MAKNEQQEGENAKKGFDVEEASPEMLAGVGEVLWKAQEDIKKMKEDILRETGHDESAMLKLKGIIEKVETNIKRQTENVIKSVNDKCLTTSVESKKPNQLVPVSRRTAKSGFANSDLQPIQSKHSSVGPGALSPGQQFLNLQRIKAIINPLSHDSRRLLNEKYSVSLPALKDKPEKDISELPKRQKVNFQSLSADLTKGAIKDSLNPPAMSADDANQGLLFLIERNFIPNSAKITLDPSPVQLKQAKLHVPGTVEGERKEKKGVKKIDEQTAKTSDSRNVTQSTDRVISRQSRVTFRNQDEKARSLRNRASTSNTDFQFGNRDDARNTISAFSDVTSIKGTQALVPFPTPTFEEGNAVHKFIIQNGATRTSTDDFIAFKQFYQTCWGSIVSLLTKMEKFLVDYSIPIAIIDGDQFVDLALYFEGNLNATKEDLMTCMMNGDDVNRFLMIPGRRYIAEDGRDEAATRIQASYRRYRDRCAYLLYRKRRWAAGLLALNWIMFCKISVIKKQLRSAREGHLQRYKLRAKVLKQSWEKIKSSKRVIIHIPSMGYPQQVRDFLPDIRDRQNRQIGRIFEAMDPNVEIVYIWPWHFQADTINYYMKLLDMTDGRSEEEHLPPSKRCHFMSPDAAHRFPSHNMCVSTLLKYSTVTLNRIKSLIKGKTAYIVPGLMHKDDLHVADVLDVPVLGSEPDIAALYSTKSGSRRIFSDSKVDKGPSEADIYSLQQLHESFARLVVKNLHISRWLMKIDDEVSGRGTTYCDLVSHLKCYEWAQKEARRYGEKWNKKWAREATYNKILAEIPGILDKHMIILDKSRFSTWKKFLANFLSKGGIIEACPPSDSVTSLSVDVFIDPCGNSHIITAADQISGSSPYKCVGHTFPQLSVEPVILEKIVNDICTSCKNRGIIGYLSIDFVTFIDPDAMIQRVWPVGLHLYYSSCLSTFQVLRHVSEGEFSFRNSSFNVPVVVKKIRSAYRRRRRKDTEDEKEKVEERTRFAVMSSDLFHENLKSVQSNVLFQLCKSHGIGYDIKTKLGTIFTIIDQLQKDSFGILVIGENMQEALSSFALNLSLIHRDLSSNNKQPKDNIQDIIKYIQSILEMSMANMEQKEMPSVNVLEYEQERHETSTSNETQIERLESSKQITPQFKRIPCPSPVTNPASPL